MLWMAATLALTAAQPVSPAAEPVSPAAGPVPAEIEEHYRDYNLVNGFSTAAERQTLAAARVAPADPRLARIARLMRRLEAQVEEVDPGIVREDMPRPSETTFRSDLLRITSCRMDQDKGEAWIYLDVLALDHGSNVTLVGRYDSLARGGRTPSISDLLAATSGRRIRTQEIHHWMKMDGVWRRAAATLVFIAQ